MTSARQPRRETGHNPQPWKGGAFFLSFSITRNSDEAISMGKGREGLAVGCYGAGIQQCTLCACNGTQL